MTVWSFGDSWSAGYGLSTNQKTFGDQIACHYQTEHKNLSIPGYSLGIILYTFAQNLESINKDDIVLIVIPPDIRWYSQDQQRGFYSLDCRDNEWEIFLEGKTSDWFVYHHNLFIYNIQQLCRSRELQFVMMHNYGTLKLISPFEHLIDKTSFLNFEKSLTNLLGEKEWTDNFFPDTKNDDLPWQLQGKFFNENDNHPNEEGHRFIAKLLQNYLERKQNAK